ncbi:MAG: DMT family transporter [Flavobacteriaceae bacterium]|jgi:drug/metabolite transporter (DMT)-like permease|nr:DMT family transporter [Flavobacteriaceae bacterium]
MNLLSNKWILLVILSLTWGSSFILIKQSLVSYSPMEVGALRLTIAGLVLIYFGIRNFKYIPKKLMPWVVVGGCMGNFIPMFLFPIAQQKVSSSMAGILDSLVPVFVLIFGYLLFGIRSRWTQVLGAMIGFMGAIILIGNNGDGSSSDLFHSFLIVVATIFYGLNGLIVGRYLSGIPSFKLSSVVFSIWLAPALLILGFTGFFAEFRATPEQLKGLGYVSILALVGTAAAMILFYKLIQQTSAIFASVVTYFMPVVAVFWGILDGEKLTLIHVLGAILILLGVYLIQLKPRNKPISINRKKIAH